MKTQLNLPVSYQQGVIVDNYNNPIIKANRNSSETPLVPNERDELLKEVAELINNANKVAYCIAADDDRPIAIIMSEKDNKEEIISLCTDAYQEELATQLRFLSIDYMDHVDGYSLHFKDEESYKFKLYVTPIAVYK